MKKRLTNTHAITLIALVITIVVLIILAAVAINLSLGNNGIFNRAKTAKEQYTNAQEDEINKTEGITNQIDSYTTSGVGSARDVTYCTTPATTTSTASVTNPCVVIENYRNGMNWYRVWSDGWIEQGGHATAGTNETGAPISLNKNFTDTNYNIQFTITPTTTGSGASAREVQCQQKKTDKFYASGEYSNRDYEGFSGYTFDWYACGY